MRRAELGGSGDDPGTPATVAALLDKAAALAGLTPREALALFACRDPDASRAVVETAGRVREQVFGQRVQIIAPLRLPLRGGATSPAPTPTTRGAGGRSVLPTAELAGHAREALRAGHRRALLTIEWPGDFDPRAFESVLAAVHGACPTDRRFGWLGIGGPPLDTAAYRLLRALGVRAYELAIVTYHQPTYALLHPARAGEGFAWRLAAVERAIDGGLTDVGVTLQIGLQDVRFELLELLRHARQTEQRCGIGLGAVTVARRDTAGAPPGAAAQLDPATHQRLLAVLRLALPRTHLRLAASEPAPRIAALLTAGATSVCAGGEPGADDLGGDPFPFDPRPSRPPSLHLRVREVLRLGYLPSLCTACFEPAACGAVTTSPARPAEPHPLCQPNAILALQDYLEHSADQATCSEGRVALMAHLARVRSRGLRQATRRQLLQRQAARRERFP